MINSRPSLALVAILALAACGGGGSSGGSSSMLPPSSGPAANAHAKASVSFFVPSGAKSQSGKRRNTLPAATQSVAVNVFNADGSPIAGQSPVVQNVSSCTPVSGGYQCVVNVAAPASTDLFYAVSYAGANATGAVLTSGMSYATVSSASSSSGVSITTSSVSAYNVVNIEGSFLTITIDHVAGTFSVSGFPDSSTISGTVSPLVQGDLELTITSPTNADATQGDIAYAREVPGGVLTFESTGTTTPAASGLQPSGADWGVGSGTGTCPTSNVSLPVSAVVIGGATFSPTSNAAINGVATITGGATGATANFSGSAYTITGGTGTAQNGAGTCSASNVFSSAGNSSFAPGALGVIAVGAQNPGGMNESDGGIGFAFGTAVNPGANLSAITQASYDGFFGAYTDDATTKQSGPIVVTPAGANTLQICPYVTFPTTPLTTGCGSITFAATQPLPGLLLASLTTTAALGSVGTAPAIVTASQVGGEWVIFGVTSGGGNFALTEHTATAPSV